MTVQFRMGCSIHMDENTHTQLGNNKNILQFPVSLEKPLYQVTSLMKLILP